ncbi:MAG TPA: hypothetical protein VGM90_08305 [Kofleriaceae bacterium]|jgi:hypothetical protein
MRLRLTTLACAALLGSCITPSIPIPPPDAGDIDGTITGDGDQKVVSFTYPPTNNYIGTTVFIYDRSKGHGIIEDAHADGSVGPTAPVRADLGDEIVFSFQRDDQTVSTCIKLREGAQSSVDYCGS